MKDEKIKQIKERIAIMQAYVDGSIIEYYDDTLKDWEIVTTPIFLPTTIYRIKKKQISFLDFLKDNKIDVTLFLDNCKIENQRWNDIKPYYNKPFKEVFEEDKLYCINNAFHWENSYFKKSILISLSTKWGNIICSIEDHNITFK